MPEEVEDKGAIEEWLSTRAEYHVGLIVPKIGEKAKLVAMCRSNAKYLLDFLSVVGTEKVIIELKDEVSQGVLHPAGEEASKYTYVVMPMRI